MKKFACGKLRSEVYRSPEVEIYEVKVERGFHDSFGFDGLQDIDGNGVIDESDYWIFGY